MKIIFLFELVDDFEQLLADTDGISLLDKDNSIEGVADQENG